MSQARLVGTVLLVAGLGAVGFLLFQQTGQNTTYYFEVAEVDRDKLAGRAFKMSGIVAAESVVKNPETLETRFVVTDESGGPRFDVTYTGALPDIFRDGIQVVVHGEFASQGVFVADDLMAKCPSKYQQDGNPADFDGVGGYDIEYDHRTGAAPESVTGSPRAPL